ncbi:MAG: hypothetical protein QOK17_1139 [Sphingomonadales bacterium]|jgi:hypothetical protein|nr:hypothetical protein [Sphingomonadales bacterium]
MRSPTLVFLPLTLLFAAPAAADDLGKRNAPPEKLLAGIGGGVSDAELQAEIDAAAAFPLGSLRNPVRVGGPEGRNVYVARLRCADGKPPHAASAVPGGTGGFGTVTELVALDCAAAAPGRFDLILDLYHEEHVEDRAPAGFTLAPR